MRNYLSTQLFPSYSCMYGIPLVGLCLSLEDFEHEDVVYSLFCMEAIYVGQFKPLVISVACVLVLVLFCGHESLFVVDMHCG